MNKPSVNKSARDFDANKKSGKFELKYWEQPKQINGRKVYQRNDLFDPNFKDADGLTNIERMNEGLAPIGYDGEKINMHHLIQMEPGSMAEVGGKFHSDNTNVLHLPDQKSFRRPDGRKADWPKTKTGRYKQTPQSSQYDTWRKNYWKTRANDFKK